MSKFRSEQIDQPINLTGTLTGNLVGTASYATFAENGGGGGTINTGSLLTTASVSSNTITFTKGDGSTFPITVNTGSGGSGTGFPFNGNAVITGSLLVSGSGIIVTGSLNAPNITGSLFGTASWANNAVSALSANTAANGGVTSVDIVTGYPLAMNGGQTTGDVEIKTSYTQLTQIISQTGGNAPVPDNTPINTTEETYTWGRDNEGIYTLTANNSATPFTSGKTAIQLTAGNINEKPSSLSYYYISTSQIKVYAWSLADGVLSDDILSKATIDIKIFP